MDPIFDLESPSNHSFFRRRRQQRLKNTMVMLSAFAILFWIGHLWPEQPSAVPAAAPSAPAAPAVPSIPKQPEPSLRSEELPVKRVGRSRYSPQTKNTAPQKEAHGSYSQIAPPDDGYGRSAVVEAVAAAAIKNGGLGGSRHYQGPAQPAGAFNSWIAPYSFPDPSSRRM